MVYERQKSQRDPTVWTTRRLPSHWDGLGAQALQKERKQQNCVMMWSVETSRRQLDVQARVQRDTGLKREIWGWLNYRWHFRPGDRMRSSKERKQKRIERKRLKSLQHFEVVEEASAKGTEKTDEWYRRKPGRVGSPGRQWVREARRRTRDQVLRYWWESEGRTEAHDLDQSSCGEQWGWEPEGRGLRKKIGAGNWRRWAQTGLQVVWLQERQRTWAAAGREAASWEHGTNTKLTDARGSDPGDRELTPQGSRDEVSRREGWDPLPAWRGWPPLFCKLVEEQSLILIKG